MSELHYNDCGHACCLRVENLAVTIGGSQILKDMNLHVHCGEMVALIGPNGAGKSTFLKAILGQRAYTGVIAFSEPGKRSHKPRIGYVPQSPAFDPSEPLSVADLFACCMSKRPAFLGISKAMDETVRVCLDRVHGVDLIHKRVGTLSGGELQRVLLALALEPMPNILILDEPTAVLTPQETEKLFKVLRNMRDDGKAIVIITHKMHEVEDLSDRVAILRHGQFVGDMLTRETNAQEMTNMMVGRPVTLNIDRPAPVNAKPRIVVEHLTVKDMEGTLKLDDVSFTANSGEILGIAGISGCGQKELLEAIAGLQPTQSGSIRYVEDDGREEELIGKDPTAIASLGVGLSFVPEDRLGMGLVGSMDLTDNMMLRSFRKGHSWFTNRKDPKHLAEKVVKELEVNTPGVSTPVRRLSGGNVQKVLVGREIAAAPTVLLTAYAVRGLDINASYTIYDLINKQKQAGVAVVFVGEDLDVLLELCDRILVLCGGKVSGIVEKPDASRKPEVGMMMTRLGGKNNE